MGELGDLLELMSGARERFRTLEATLHTRRHEKRAAEAFERYKQAASSGMGIIRLGSWGDEPPPEVSEERIRLWLEQPARSRIEAEAGWIMVCDGERAWSYAPRTGTTIQEREAELPLAVDQTPAGLLLDPTPLLASFDFELRARPGQTSDDAIRVRAAPRDGLEMDAHDFAGLAPGGDEYELLVDPERGTILRAVALLEGEEFGLSELVDARFDVSIPSERFRFEPPTDAPVRSVEELRQLASRPEHLPIEAAAARASFPVWLPAKLGADWELRVMYMPAAGDWYPRERVHIHAHRIRGRDADLESLQLEQTAVEEEARPSEPGWERLERQGQELFVLKHELAPATVWLERSGTAVSLTSEQLSREGLLELATSLVPAPTQRPEFRS